MAIDYYAADGVEAFEFAPTPEASVLHGPEHEAVREILKADARWQAMANLRHAYLRAEAPRCRLVTGPLTILELVEWHADAVFRNLCSEVAGAESLQRRGRKDIGQRIERLRQKADVPDTAQNEPPSPALAAWRAMSVVPSFVMSHGLRGVAIADVLAPLTDDFAYGIGSALAQVQIGGADILHLFAAHHLGCQYFASFDSDFKRVRSIIQEHLALTLLSSPAELQGALV